MGVEDFVALPTSVQMGIVGFVVAIALLTIAQALNISSDRSKAQKASFDALHAEIRRLRHETATSTHPRTSSHGLAPSARPTKPVVLGKPVVGPRRAKNPSDARGERAVS
jgi:hypothetical protein